MVKFKQWHNFHPVACARNKCIIDVVWYVWGEEGAGNKAKGINE